MRRKVTEEAIGKWPSILSALGVDKRYLVNRHGPCPLCDGKDRFRFDDKDGRGSWFCNQCGAGDGWSLVMKLKGWDFKTAAREVKPLAGVVQPIRVRTGPDEKAVRDEMNTIWRSAKPLDSVLAADAWWRLKVGVVPDCADLRAHDALAAPGSQGRYPAILAIVRGSDGKPVNLHRTFLNRTGDKADIPSPRRVMPLPMPDGCAVRLFAYTDTLGIAEGLETAVSAHLLTGIPVWAALNAGNLEKWRPPVPGLRIVVFGEHDASFTGQAAAFRLARALRAMKPEEAPASVEVRIPGIEIDPRMTDMDWNDVHQRKREREFA